jgi:hypothetical protein
MPDEFWAARTTFGHMRTAARAGLILLDGVFAAILMRVAALTDFLPAGGRLPRGSASPPTVNQLRSHPLSQTSEPTSDRSLIRSALAVVQI